MSRLSKENQDLIMDFYFRCGDEEAINRGRDLIASNPEAADLYAKLEATLTELDHIKYEPCPDNLVDLTVARLRQVSDGQARLAELFHVELQKTPDPSIEAWPTRKRLIFHNFFKVAAVAAVFVLVSGIGLPVFSNMRQSSWKTVCTANLGQAGQGIARYSEDHEGQLPYVPMIAGSPWFRLGEQGNENQSNSRHIFQLVKGGYIPQNILVCPGHKGAVSVRGDAKALAQQDDFPCRKYISYSYILLCDKVRPNPSGTLVILADRSPLFGNLCYCSSCQSKNRNTLHSPLARLDQAIADRMSMNHRGTGQNVLRFDGSTSFVMDRLIGGDDMYSIQGVNEYQGFEIPCMDKGDIFLAP